MFQSSFCIKHMALCFYGKSYSQISNYLRNCDIVENKIVFVLIF